MQELDLRLLSAITQHTSIALDFSLRHDPKLFIDQESRVIAKPIIDYVKAYKTRPTKRTLLEKYSSDSDTCQVIENFWDNIENIKYDEADYPFDLDQLKKRYGKALYNELKNQLHTNTDNPLSEIKNVESVINEIKSLNKTATYTQKSLKDHLSDFNKSYQAKLKDPELGKGILTGFSYLDYIKNGLRPSDLVVIAGETGAGKALAIDTLIPTPKGWTTMGDIKVGDKVFDENGNICNVVAVSGIMYNHNCYEIEFSDGSKIVADEGHLWKTLTAEERFQCLRRTLEYRTKRNLKRGCRTDINSPNIKEPPSPSVRTTKQIAETIKRKRDNRLNHSVALAKPLQLSETNLLIDPYFLGLWLGDGNSRGVEITSADDEILNFVNNYAKSQKLTVSVNNTNSKAKQIRIRKINDGPQKNHILEKFRHLNLIQNKHIPSIYLRASFEQRLALLQGLMDSDGHINKKGNCEFTTIKPKLNDDVLELLHSLGISTYSKKKPEKYVIKFTTSLPVFRLQKKLNKIKTKTRFSYRFIKNVVKVKSVPVQCIQVDSPTHMFLCGKEMIPTHNSILLNNMAINIWKQTNTIDTDKDNYKKGYNVAYFSLEMPFEDCFQRTIAALADVPSYHIRDAQLTRAEAVAVKKSCEFINKYPHRFDIIDIPRGLTVEGLELHFERIKSQYKPDVVFIDYLGLMEEHSGDGDDWLKLGILAGKVHEFGRVYDIPVVTAVQLNRLPIGDIKKKEEHDAKKIGLHRIGRSSLIATHATLIIQIENRINEGHLRDFKYHILKNRHGESGGFHSITKNFAHCIIKDSPYDVELQESYTENYDISEDVSDIFAELDQL